MKKKTILGYLIACLMILGAWLSTDMTTQVITLQQTTTPYDTAQQEEIHEQIEQMKQATAYDPSHMLLIHDPYGTNTCSLYVYFQSETALAISYSIRVEGSDIEDYTNIISSSYSYEHEFQIIGLIPDQLNTITITMLDEQGKAVTYTTTYKMGSLRGEEAVQLSSEAGESTESLSNGLYVLLGNDQDDQKNFMYLYDKNGTLRGEIPLGDFRSHRIVFDDDLMYFSYSTQSIAAMNNLGQIVRTYALDGYELHHDYVLDDQGNLLLLASDLTKSSTEDQILRLNLTTGSFSLIADLTQTMAAYYLSTSDPTSDTLDWLHLNTIQSLGNAEIILSSRETSTILKLSNIYEEPVIDYLIAEETFWDNTAYESLLLTKNGSFSTACGQHSVTYVSDDSLKDGQYYLLLFNNNFGYSKSVSSYDWSQIPDVAVKTNDELAVSRYEKYLVDEHHRTYELVESFDVPFSPYISSVQDVEGNHIIASGIQNILQEYDADQQLIRSFLIESGNYVYRVYNYTFHNFYFYQ